MFTWFQRSAPRAATPPIQETPVQSEISTVASAALPPADPVSGSSSSSFSWTNLTGSLFGTASSKSADVDAEKRNVAEGKEPEEISDREKGLDENDFLLIEGEPELETSGDPTRPVETKKPSPSMLDRFAQAPAFVQKGVGIVAGAAAIVALPIALAAIPVYLALEERALWKEFVEYLAREHAVDDKRISVVLEYVKKDPSAQSDLKQRNFDEAYQKATNAEALEQLQSYLIAARPEALEQLEEFLKKKGFTDLEVEQWLSWAKTDPWFEYAIHPNNRDKAFELIARGIEKERNEERDFKEREKRASELMNKRLENFYNGYKTPILHQIEMVWFKQELAKKATEKEMSELIEKTISETGTSFIRRAVLKQRNEEEMQFFTPDHPVKRAFDVLSANAEFRQLVLDGKWNSAEKLVVKVTEVLEKQMPAVKKTTSFMPELYWYADDGEASGEGEATVAETKKPLDNVFRFGTTIENLSEASKTGNLVIIDDYKKE